MDSSHITTDQAAKIKDAIGPAFGYLSRLVRRSSESRRLIHFSGCPTPCLIDM